MLQKRVAYGYEALKPQHADYFRTRAIPDSMVRDQQIESFYEGNTVFGGREGFAYRMTTPLKGSEGEQHVTGYWRFRPDEPRLVDGQPVKEEQPKGTSVNVFLPRCCFDDCEHADWYVFTESPFKAMALAAHLKESEINAVVFGLCGIYGWIHKRELHPDFTRFNFDGKHCTVLFDADALDKPQVRYAGERLRLALEGRGATADVMLPLKTEQGPGIDDFLAAGHQLEECEQHERMPNVRPSVPEAHAMFEQACEMLSLTHDLDAFMDAAVPAVSAFEKAGLTNYKIAVNELGKEIKHRFLRDLNAKRKEFDSALAPKPKAKKATGLQTVQVCVDDPPMKMANKIISSEVLRTRLYVHEGAIWIVTPKNREKADWKQFRAYINNVVLFVTSDGEPITPTRAMYEDIYTNAFWLLSHSGNVIEEFVSRPILNEDGSITCEPGYHSPRYLMRHDFEEVTFDPEPTKEKAKRALEYLRDLMSEAAMDEMAKDSFIIATLTAAARHAIPGPVPAIGVTAEAAGVGKDMVCEIIQTIGFGRKAHLLAQKKRAGERTNELYSVAQQTEPVPSVVIANLEGKFHDQDLCNAITSTRVSHRKYYAQEFGTSAFRSMVFMNGINFSLSTDLVRRTLMIRMHSGVERPEKRTFTRDLESYVELRKRQLYADALMPVRAYLAAKCPRADESKNIGGFTEWSRLILGTLEWMGMDVALEAMRKDEEIDRLTEALRLWHEGPRVSPWGNQKAKLSRIRRRINKSLAAPEQGDQDFAMAICELVGNNAVPERIAPSLLRSALKRYENRRAGGFMLVPEGTGWKVERVAGGK